MEPFRIAFGRFRLPKNRRAIHLITAALISFILAFPAPLLADVPDLVPTLPEEDFKFHLRFLWFKQVARARLRIRRISGKRYRAELLAETKGFLGFLTGNRKNHYISVMEYVPEKGRLVTRRFTKTVSWGGEVVKSVTEIDYERGIFQWVATENGMLKDKGSEPIPRGVIYEDLLSAFFNLRLGAFGPLTRGRHIRVTSLPYYQASDEDQTEYQKEFIRTFVIRIADASTERDFRRRFSRESEKGLLVFVQVPKALFGQKSGEVLVWFNTNLIPPAVRVEDVILFGDVSGVLQLPTNEKRGE